MNSVKFVKILSQREEGGLIIFQLFILLFFLLSFSFFRFQISENNNSSCLSNLKRIRMKKINKEIIKILNKQFMFNK